MTQIAAPRQLDTDRLRALLRDQDGVVTRRQVLECGGGAHDIARMVRHAWARLLPGVYVDHTGPPTWQQRAWAGVLFHWPAALADRSAVRAAVGPGWRGNDDAAALEILVSHDRRVRSMAGYHVRRTRDFDDQVQWNRHPPRQRTEDAVLDLAACAASDLDAVGVVADACRTRRTTAPRLLDRLAARSRISRRTWLGDVLEDVVAGTCSVLEHGHLIRVERAHGLPAGRRQAPGLLHGRPYFRDVVYDFLHVQVELDGRLFHDHVRQRDRDLDRDLEAALTGTRSVRLGWGQVFDRPCWTAARVAVLLQRGGWTGRPQPCGPGCPVEPGPGAGGVALSW